MEDFDCLEPTGREIKGPIETLLEMTHTSGLKRTAVVFDPQYRAHPDLGFGLQTAMAFLEKTGVCNLLDVSEHDARQGGFSYATGTCWSLAELLEGLADAGQVAGPRAGLELCYLTASILHEANKVGPDVGLFCHGNLNPWRIMVKVDGQVQLIGYGLPQVDVLIYREEDGDMPSEDGLRYCPPERLEGNPEDVPGDILSLALIAFELMAGEPLYNGLAKEIHQQAINGQGPYRLFQFRDVLPESVIELLSRALKYDADARFVDANEFVWAVKDVIGLPDIDGMSLAEVVQTVRHHKEQGTAIMGGKTSSISKEDLKAMRELLDAPDEKPLPPPPEGRPSDEPDEEDDDQPKWGKVSRARMSGEHAPPMEEAVEKKRRPDRSDALKRSSDRADRLRDRLRRSKEDRRQSLKDRLSRDRKDRKLRASQEFNEEEEIEASDQDANIENEAVPEVDEMGPGIQEDESELVTLDAEDIQAEDEEVASPLDSEPEQDEAEPQISAEDANEKSDEPSVPSDADESREQPAEEEKTVSDKPLDAAAELLARLRSSQDLRASQAQVDVAGEDVVSPEEETHDEGLQALGDDASPEADSVEEPSTPPADEQGTLRTVPIASNPPNLSASGAQRAVYQVGLEGQTPRSVKLKLSDPICESASRLGQALAGIPTDLSGRITGWYRIRQGGAFVDGQTFTESLDPGVPVEVVRIASSACTLTIQTEGMDDEIRFQAPVSTHVPSAYLLGHLISWLDLPGDGWRLYVDEQALLPMQTLSEFGLSSGSILTVKK